MAYFGVKVTPSPTSVRDKLRNNYMKSEAKGESLYENIQKRVSTSDNKEVNTYRSKLDEPERASVKKLDSTRNKKPLTNDKTEKNWADRNKRREERRMQRVNSREALLQSQSQHSSSEDLVGEVVRKGKVVRRTKMAQLSVSGGVEVKKKKEKKIEDDTRKTKTNASRLPEITHKCAVSTIKSTAEKAAEREVKRRSAGVRGHSSLKSNPKQHSTISSKDYYHQRQSSANVVQSKFKDGHH